VFGLPKVSFDWSEQYTLSRTLAMGLPSMGSRAHSIEFGFYIRYCKEFMLQNLSVNTTTDFFFYYLLFIFCKLQQLIILVDRNSFKNRIKVLFRCLFIILSVHEPLTTIPTKLQTIFEVLLTIDVSLNVFVIFSSDIYIKEKITKTFKDIDCWNGSWKLVDARY
jgi:hypothetical protein